MTSWPHLQQGQYQHFSCLSCLERAPLKNYLDDSTLWIVRRRRCQGEIVDFSLVLQIKRGSTWRNVTRYSVAHANFHQYVFGIRHPTKPVIRNDFGPLDTHTDLIEAYGLAAQLGLQQTEKWLDTWRRLT